MFLLLTTFQLVPADLREFFENVAYFLISLCPLGDSLFPVTRDVDHARFTVLTLVNIERDMFFATSTLAVGVTAGTSHSDEITSHDVVLVDEFGELREQASLFFGCSGSGFHGSSLYKLICI